jgi:hypothetical protein
VTIAGGSFVGRTVSAEWVDPSAQLLTKLTTTASVLSTRRATAIEPLILQIQGTGTGTLALAHSNALPFSFTNLQSCFKAGITGATGPVGATGAMGGRGDTGGQGVSGATGVTGATGAQGATGANGTNGTNGERGAPGATGPKGATGPPSGAGSRAECLVRGATERGEWSVSMASPTNGPQVQASGVVSYPIPLCEEEVLKLEYVSERNEFEGGIGGGGCLGSAAEPVAESGFLCVYRQGSPGAQEPKDMNAAFFGFQAPNGANGETGTRGELIVFRTSEFNEVTPIRELTSSKSPVILSAGGTWAVTAK